jgi:hypothetical protein
MPHRLSLPARRLSGALVLGLVVAFGASGATFAADSNTGTVKVQDGANDPQPEVRNEPHVCTFHLSFFFATPAQAGDWSIDQQPPTGRATQVLSGLYTTDAQGYAHTTEFGLPAGHYKLYWDGRSDLNLKHKTFWVTCDNPVGEIVHLARTGLTTALNGQAATLTVQAGDVVFDTAVLDGATATASGTVVYSVFADPMCTMPLGDPETVTVVDAVVPASTPSQIWSGGTFYWQAEYSGDHDNLGSLSPCGSETLTVLSGG